MLFYKEKCHGNQTKWINWADDVGRVEVDVMRVCSMIIIVDKLFSQEIYIFSRKLPLSETAVFMTHSFLLHTFMTLISVKADSKAQHQVQFSNRHSIARSTSIVY